MSESGAPLLAQLFFPSLQHEWDNLIQLDSWLFGLFVNHFANFHSLLLLSIWKLKMKLLAFFCDQLNQRGLSVRWVESLSRLFLLTLCTLLCAQSRLVLMLCRSLVCWQTSKFRSDNIFAVLSIHIYFLTPLCPLLSRSCANTTKTKRFIVFLFVGCPSL